MAIIRCYPIFTDFSNFPIKPLIYVFEHNVPGTFASIPEAMGDSNNADNGRIWRHCADDSAAKLLNNNRDNGVCVVALQPVYYRIYQSGINAA